MGSGASKKSAGSAPPATAKKQLTHSQSTSGRIKKAREASKDSEEPDEFHNACMFVFQQADKDGDGSLDEEEFWSVLSSETLNLNLSREEMEEIKRMSDQDGDGRISYNEFIPVIKLLVSKVYSQKSNDWNDWCQFEDSTGKTYFLNKRTGQVQKERPPNFNENRVEEAQFAYITLPDGTEHTTYVTDEGKRMYMDWDAQCWKECPAEWLTAAAGGEEDMADSEDDPRVGEYQHPTRGTFPTYLFENVRNTRLYFDEKMGEWARMPLAWERNVPEVKAMLDGMDKMYPAWGNINEQLLALRECNYDYQDALVFAEINWQFGSKSGGTGSMSADAAQKIHSLEKKLAQKESELSSIRDTLEADKKQKLSNLTREKTQVENLMKRKDRTSKEAEEKILELSKDNATLQDRVGELERLLLEHKADSEKIELLEKQLAAASGGGGGVDTAAFKDLQHQLEALRMQNVTLKMKMQAAKERLANPAKSPAAAKLFGDLHRKVRELQQEKNAAKIETQQNIKQLSSMFGEACLMSKSLAENTKSQLEDITAKYRAEVLQRKLLYNKVQELRGNIRVFCRVRFDKRVECVHQFPGPTELMAKTLTGDMSMIEFDQVFSPQSSQEQVFTDTKPIILSVVDGYNVCIMAYGQTGSGKTYTMMGPPDNPGVNRRAIRELVDLITKQQEIEFTLAVSMLEVYNEKIYDLLVASRTQGLKVHQGPNGVYVGNLTEEMVATVEDVESVMMKGDSNRSTSATAMNTDSSRSHLILQIKVTGYNTISKVTTHGKLTLVDLAGSERVSKSEAAGERLLEAAAINKSLTALGQVFTAIGRNAPHVPYRNSKLTHVLQDSLGGDSKTAVFVNISPAESNLSETHCTLNFGKNIRKIELGPATKHKSAGGLPPPPKKRGGKRK